MAKKKGGKAESKESKEQVVFTDPEQRKIYLDFRKNVGKEILDEIQTATDKLDDVFRDRALADFKENGVEINAKKADQQIFQWRAENVKPKENLKEIWKTLGFEFDEDDLEKQLFHFKRPRAVPGKAGTITWETRKTLGLCDFLIIYQDVMRDKNEQIEALSSAFRSLGDGTQDITPEQIRFAMKDLQQKMRGTPLSDDQLAYMLKVAGAGSNPQTYAKIECKGVATKVIDTITGSGGGKKKGKKKKKKKK
eukprot:CAMPEP_0184492416 /NCGR_PEP_ID=MMETSP0113_2-20130426/23167_1 /TAXON_ID=91329 /ORGANISM="Norrisiella sphaerica, Strain BC52" /LENGTH=250 /DNA_ID=CAMNT_0026877203 /DNA_START=90 /DNA_END=842 /DNA_ORIENTATION=+